MRSGADLRGASPLVSCNHVIDPHFVAFSSSLYTTISNPKPNPNLTSNPDPDRNPNPNRNPTVITDPQTGPIDPQIVTVHIHPADPTRSAFGRVPNKHTQKKPRSKRRENGLITFHDIRPGSKLGLFFQSHSLHGERVVETHMGRIH